MTEPCADAAGMKRALRAELVAHLKATLATIERAHRLTKEAATHEEAKPENDKDTRALEQSYLARGQALRVDEVRASIVAVEATPVTPLSPGGRAAVGALVVAEEDEQQVTYWIAAEGGGTRLDSGKIQVVTPKSPLGRALIGKLAGDECEVAVAGRTRMLMVVEVL